MYSFEDGLYEEQESRDEVQIGIINVYMKRI